MPVREFLVWGGKMHAKCRQHHGTSWGLGLKMKVEKELSSSISVCSDCGCDVTDCLMVLLSFFLCYDELCPQAMSQKTPFFMLLSPPSLYFFLSQQGESCKKEEICLVWRWRLCPVKTTCLYDVISNLNILREMCSEGSVIVFDSLFLATNQKF